MKPISHTEASLYSISCYLSKYIKTQDCWVIHHSSLPVYAEHLRVLFWVTGSRASVCLFFLSLLGFHVSHHALTLHVGQNSVIIFIAEPLCLLAVLES